MSDELTRTSKFLSLVLRHKPEEIGLSLDENGWADVNELLTCAASSGRVISWDLLRRVVVENDKQRFILDEENSRIRANQGHSVAIDLGLQPKEPPEKLFHGTATRFVSSIHRDGLVSRGRQHVHLSLDAETAIKVGQRHGKPIVLIVNAQAMHSDGHAFYLSENSVWLTSSVPVKYIDFPESADEA